MQKMEMQLKGQLCLYYFEGLLRPFPPHFHDKIFIGAILRGIRKVQVGGRALILRKGDVLVLPAFCPHSCASCSGGAVTWISMHINPQAIPHLASQLSAPWLLQDQPQLGGFMQKVKDPTSSPFLQRLEEILLTATKQSLRSPFSDHWKGLCRWLEHSLTEKISLAQMGKLTGLDKYKLIRNFQNDLGITPYRYLESLRINYASRLLGGLITLSECSLKSGFYDQAQFTRVFRLHMGMPPGIWRRRLLSGEGICHAPAKEAAFAVDLAAQCPGESVSWHI